MSNRVKSNSVKYLLIMLNKLGIHSSQPLYTSWFELYGYTVRVQTKTERATLIKG